MTVQVLATSQSGLLMSVCVLIIVCLHVFISAPAAYLRLTCLPAPCVKCVWPKNPPCGCMLLCWMAAGVQHEGLSPCQHPPSANVLAAVLVRSPGGERWAKTTDSSGTEWHKSHKWKHTGSHKHIYLTHSSHMSCSSTAVTVEDDGTGKDADDKCQWLNNRNCNNDN